MISYMQDVSEDLCRAWVLVVSAGNGKEALKEENENAAWREATRKCYRKLVGKNSNSESCVRAVQTRSAYWSPACISSTTQRLCQGERSLLLHWALCVSCSNLQNEAIQVGRGGISKVWGETHFLSELKMRLQEKQHSDASLLSGDEFNKLLSKLVNLVLEESADLQWSHMLWGSIMNTFTLARGFRFFFSYCEKQKFKIYRHVCRWLRSCQHIFFFYSLNNSETYT